MSLCVTWNPLPRDNDKKAHTHCCGLENLSLLFKVEKGLRFDDIITIDYATVSIDCASQLDSNFLNKDPFETLFLHDHERLKGLLIVTCRRNLVSGLNAISCWN